MTLQLKTGVSEELIQSVGEGSREAFLSLYEQSAQAVYAYALSILHNSQDAEDAMQDTFLKVRGAAHLYRPQGKPMAWIFTIARNVCMMQLRNRQHECSGETEYDHQADGNSSIESLDDQLVLRKTLEILEPTESQIILLHAVTGLKHREIAEMLELPLSTVLSKYHRGLKKLKKKLEGSV